jgi:hypothetical protein
MADRRQVSDQRRRHDDWSNFEDQKLADVEGANGFAEDVRKRFWVPSESIEFEVLAGNPNHYSSLGARISIGHNSVSEYLLFRWSPTKS